MDTTQSEEKFIITFEMVWLVWCRVTVDERNRHSAGFVHAKSTSGGFQSSKLAYHSISVSRQRKQKQKKNAQVSSGMRERREKQNSQSFQFVCLSNGSDYYQRVRVHSVNCNAPPSDGCRGQRECGAVSVGLGRLPFRCRGHAICCDIGIGCCFSEKLSFVDSYCGPIKGAVSTLHSWLESYV